MSIDIKTFTDNVAYRVKSMLDPIAQRIKSLERGKPERGEKGEKGRPGYRPTVDIEYVIPQLVKAPGIIQAVKDAVAEQYAANPPPAGEKGDPGKDGEPGETPTVHIEEIISELSKSPEILKSIKDEVVNQYKENPPSPGEKGEPGKDGLGEIGRAHV